VNSYTAPCQFSSVQLRRTVHSLTESTEKESPAIAREDILQLIQFLLQYWPSRSSKVDDYHRILLVTNSNLGRISHRSEIWPVFRWKRTFSLPFFIQPRIWKCSSCTILLKFCLR